MKTLKDLGFEHTDKDGRLFTEKELKTEAVKVVNECCKFIDECGTNPSRKDMYLLNIKWVNFLNLTEKDLDWEKQK